MKNILLLDKDPILGGNFKSCIEADGDDWSFVGQSASINNLGGFFCGQPVAFLLVGLELSLEERTHMMLQTQEMSPQTKVIWLVSKRDDGSIGIPQFVDGVDGYLLRETAVTELLFCLQLIGMGDKYLSSALYTVVVKGSLPAHPILGTFISPSSAFSLVELQLLESAANGVSSVMIGQRLSMSLSAVNENFRQLFQKTGTANYTSLIRFAHDHGIVSRGNLL